MEKLLQTGQMDEECAASIIRQLVETLAYCHAHGFVHRVLGLVSMSYL